MALLQNGLHPRRKGAIIGLILHGFFPYSDAVFYAITLCVHCDNNADAHIRVGTSGAMKTWCNDNLVITEPEETNNDVDTYIAPCAITKRVEQNS
jgi:hypothetical protein